MTYRARRAFRAPWLLLFLPLFLVCWTLGEAQPRWVTDAQGMSPPFPLHKEAGWITLVNDVVIQHSPEDVATHTTRQAFKILRADATEKAFLTILTSPNHILHTLRGWHLSPGKDTEEIDEDDAVITNPTATPGYYSDYRKTIAGFQDVKPGDVVAFEYALEEKGPTARHDVQVFRDRQPLLQSRCAITVPEGFTISYSGYGIDSVRRTESGRTSVWTAPPSPCDPEEPLEPPSLSAAGVLVTVLTNDNPGSFGSWERIVGWERERVEPAVVASSSISEMAAKLDASGSLPWQKIAGAARFVQQEIRYVAVELGEGAWTPRPGSETLANRFGDCKDKVILLRSLLNALDIPSASTLACTTTPVLPDVPSPFQFNHVIIAIPATALGPGHGWEKAIVDGWFFFDPTDAAVPPGALPGVLLGDRVLVCAPGVTGLTRLPSANPADNLVTVEGSGRIEADGRVETAIRMVLHGSSAHALRRALLSSSDAAKEEFTDLNEGIPDLAVTGVAVADSVDSLIIGLTAKGHGLLSSSGAENLFRVNFLRFHTPPRLVGKTRVHPLWLGPAETQRIRLRWEYGEYLEGPDTLFQQKSVCRGNSVSTEIRSSRKKVEFLHTHTRSNDVIPAEEYGAVRSFLGAVERSIPTSIQLRKTFR